MKFLPLVLLSALSASSTAASALGSGSPAKSFIRRTQEDCAGDGGRAQECGAANEARPEKCCEGFVCVEGASVRCIAEGGADAEVDADVEPTPADDVEEEPPAEEEVPEDDPVEEEPDDPAPVEDDPNCAKVRLQKHGRDVYVYVSQQSWKEYFV